MEISLILTDVDVRPGKSCSVGSWIREIELLDFIKGREPALDNIVNSDLVNDFYGTSIYSNKWPPLLDKLYPICNAKYAAIAVIEKAPDRSGKAHTINCISTNLDAEAHRYYAEKFSHYEAGHAKLVFEGRVGEMIVDPDFDDLEKISQRPDVIAAKEHMGLFHRFAVRLNDDGAWSDCIAFQYGPERLTNATPEEYARVQPYIQHIGQAISMGRIYDSIRRRYQAVLSMLDRVNVGMMLLRSDGAVVISNSFARQIIDESGRLSVSSRGYLAANSKNENAELTKKIELLQSSNTDVSKLYMRLGGDLEDDDLVIELSRLVDDEGDVGAGFSGVMAIIVDPNRPFSAGFESLSSIYSLTSSETELANLIANGLDYKAAAEHRGVSRETIKTHSRNLMRKMKVESRAGVVRRLLSLGIPFVDK